MATPAGSATSPERQALRLARLRFHARRLGWYGLAGMLLMALALAFELTTVREMQRQAAAIDARIEALNRQAAASPPGAPARRAAGPRRSFPRREALAAAVERIHALAEEQGLAHESGDYRELPPDAGQRDGLMRYRLSLPLRGAYPAWRAWLAAVMNELPAVALDGFSLKRDDVANPAVDAQVRLTLYFEAR